MDINEAHKVAARVGRALGRIYLRRSQDETWGTLEGIFCGDGGARNNGDRHHGGALLLARRRDVSSGSQGVKGRIQSNARR